MLGPVRRSAAPKLLRSLEPKRVNSDLGAGAPRARSRWRSAFWPRCSRSARVASLCIFGRSAAVSMSCVDVGCVLLAAGTSSRMGTNQLFLELADLLKPRLRASQKHAIGWRIRKRTWATTGGDDRSTARSVGTARTTRTAMMKAGAAVVSALLLGSLPSRAQEAHQSLAGGAESRATPPNPNQSDDLPQFALAGLRDSGSHRKMEAST